MKIRTTNFRTVWKAVKQAAWGFLGDDAFTLAAALAFYSMLSLAPLLVLLTTVLGFLSDSTQDRIVDQATALVGPHASEGVKMILKHAQERRYQATVGAAISLGGSLLTATAVFARLQYSLNLIFHVRTKRGYVMGWLYKRGLSLLMVLAMGIVLIVSAVFSSVMLGLFADRSAFLHAANFLLNFAVVALIFVIMFKVLPDVEIGWKTAIVGGVISAVLLVMGEFGMSLYFARTAVASLYGAAGSLAILLLWVFYSTMIVFYGAELTQAYGQCCGKEIVPNKFAEWDVKTARKRA